MMKDRLYIIGNYITKLESNITLSSEYNYLGFAYNGESHHFRIIIDEYNNIIDKAESSSFLKRLDNYDGIYKDFYYTFLYEYGLVAISDIKNKTTYLGLKEGLFTIKSFYLIRSIIQKHILRHIFQTDTPLHASCVVDPSNNAAILIIGEQGAGKSTFGKELKSLNYTLIADDIVVLKRNTNRVSGYSEGIFLRPDTIKGIENSVVEVSPGRKYFLSNEEAKIYENLAVKTMVILNKNYEEKTSITRALDHIVFYIERAHRDWEKSSFEVNHFKNDIFHLLNSTQIIVTNINDIDNAISNICNINKM